MTTPPIEISLHALTAAVSRRVRTHAAMKGRTTKIEFHPGDRLAFEAQENLRMLIVQSVLNELGLTLVESPLRERFEAWADTFSYPEREFEIWKAAWAAAMEEKSEELAQAHERGFEAAMQNLPPLHLPTGETCKVVAAKERTQPEEGMMGATVWSLEVPEDDPHVVEHLRLQKLDEWRARGAETVGRLIAATSLARKEEPNVAHLHVELCALRDVLEDRI